MHRLTEQAVDVQYPGPDAILDAAAVVDACVRYSDGGNIGAQIRSLNQQPAAFFQMDIDFQINNFLPALSRISV